MDAQPREGRQKQGWMSGSFAALRLLLFNAAPHGSRRGLLSSAAPQLTAWTPPPLPSQGSWFAESRSRNRPQLSSLETSATAAGKRLALRKDCAEALETDDGTDMRARAGLLAGGTG